MLSEKEFYSLSAKLLENIECEIHTFTISNSISNNREISQIMFNVMAGLLLNFVDKSLEEKEKVDYLESLLSDFKTSLTAAIKVLSTTRETH